MLKLYVSEWKDNLNINCEQICWFLLKILGIRLIFRGVGDLWQGLGVGGGPDPKKKSFNRLLIHISNIDG